ncbi:limonene-1,2-epoxide hydrolase [Mycobacterium sp. Root135]|uniref:limonene-1,2-epoxide hydrolase family protein n=1 Tax=Mycobacterium sp. Root135 TaxID=1736457 RepID=UPI000702233F|nr:limonene-1,2-epoxide hydrolase family protein [Mycobacterium sp. Root135]KQY01302.1 limonene-1,2-epoxide hydrolase [Mycobacterium sp. Root135]
MSDSLITVAETFVAHWNANRVEDALAMLSEDVLYDNVPYPNIIGREGVRKFYLDSGVGKTLRTDWKIINIAVSGNVVLNERVDDFHHLSGAVVSLPVMGTLTIDDGQITVWRDYFDAASMEQQLSDLEA